MLKNSIFLQIQKKMKVLINYENQSFVSLSAGGE